MAELWLSSGPKASALPYCAVESRRAALTKAPARSAGTAYFGKGIFTLITGQSPAKLR